MLVNLFSVVLGKLKHNNSSSSKSSQNDSTAKLCPFKRSTKTRMSLPVMSSTANNRRTQIQQPSMGHIYLQHRGETKQAQLPNELTTIDTIWALFVCAFPRWLTMEYMSLDHVKIYIYNPSCNIFYELQDIDEVKHESILRIHQSNALLALGPPPQLAPLPLVQLQYQQQQQQQQQHMQRLAAQQQQIQAPPKPRRMIPSTPTLDNQSMHQSIYDTVTPTIYSGPPKNLMDHQHMSNTSLRYPARPMSAYLQPQTVTQTYHEPLVHQQQANGTVQRNSSSSLALGQQHQIHLPPHW